MRILFVHHGEVIGGAPVSLLNTILALKEHADVEIKVLCVNESMKSFFQEKGEIDVGDIHFPCKMIGKVLIGWASLFERQNLRITFEEIFRIRTSIRKQCEQLKQEQPDIIHLNSAILFTTAIAAKRLHIPIVWHVREVLHGSSWNLRKFFAGWCIKTFADKVVAISPGEAGSLGKDTKHNIEVVYNFVDFSKFAPSLYNKVEEQKQFDVKSGEKLIAFLGGISWRKGSLELLEAMSYVHHNVKLVIAGSERVSRKRKGRSRIKRIKLFTEDILVRVGLKRFRRWDYHVRVANALRQLEHDRIVFTGPLHDVRPLLAVCDLLASPHTFSHSSRPIFEAWAMKKPVIAFDIPGISEYINNGIDGILVKKMTAKALAEAINAVIDNEVLLRSLGEQGYKKSYTYFRKEANIPKIWEIYQELRS